MQRHRGSFVVPALVALKLIVVFAACGGDDAAAHGDGPGVDASDGLPDGSVLVDGGSDPGADGGATDSGAHDAKTDGSAANTVKCTDGASQRAVVKPAAGQLVITEIMPSPDGDDTKHEW